VKGSKLDLNVLVQEIRDMQYWQPLFKVLKKELTQLGYWRNRERGNPKLGYERSKNKGNYPFSTRKD
jgi:hypothetical protein